MCFIKVHSKTVYLTIKAGSVENDDDYPFQCAINKRMELISYTYYYKTSKSWKSSQIHNPEPLFSTCSWMQTCFLNNKLVQNIKNITMGTHLGLLKIKYNCLGNVLYDTLPKCVVTVVKLLEILKLRLGRQEEKYQSGL